MKSQYTLSIDSKGAKATFKLIYINGYFKSLEKMEGKLHSNDQHNYLMNFAPSLEKAIQVLQLEWNDKGVSWLKLETPASNNVLKTLLDEYYTWYQDKNGIKAKINGTEMKALKSIVTHLGNMVSTEMELIGIWNAILMNWDNQTSYYQSQMELRQINLNLNTILRTIKDENGQDKYTR